MSILGREKSSSVYQCGSRTEIIFMTVSIQDTVRLLFFFLNGSCLKTFSKQPLECVIFCFHIGIEKLISLECIIHYTGSSVLHFPQPSLSDVLSCHEKKAMKSFNLLLSYSLCCNSYGTFFHPFSDFSLLHFLRKFLNTSVATLPKCCCFRPMQAFRHSE